MMKIMLTVLFCFIYYDGVEGTATITSLGCDSANGLSSQLTIGREYTMYCTITGSNKPHVIVWTSPNGRFLTVSENDCVAFLGFFSARFVRSDEKSITASLTFTATTSLDQIVIGCQDMNGASLDECRIQIGKSSTVFTTSTSGSTSTATVCYSASTSTVSATSSSTKDGSTSTESTTSTKDGSSSIESTTSTNDGSSSTESTTSTKDRSTVSTTSTRDGSTLIVSTLSTSGYISMASVGLGTSLALTTVPIVWSTTSQAISITPFATSTVLPTPGERNNIDIIVIITVVVIAIAIVIAIIGICLLSLCICKKLLFKSYSDSHNPSNTVATISHIYDDIKLSVPAQSSDEVKLSTNVAYGQKILGIHSEAANFTNITTSANAAYGQVSGPDIISVLSTENDDYI